MEPGKTLKKAGGVLRRTPLTLQESVVYLPNGKPLEYSSTYHRGDRTRVSISFVLAPDGQSQPAADLNEL